MLKREVCKQVELAYANLEKPFRISTDASVEGLGAVLGQQDDIGNWRPLAYGSRRVTDVKKRYDAHKLEFLALKWASSKFTVFTNNNPLTYILSDGWQHLPITSLRSYTNQALKMESLMHSPDTTMKREVIQTSGSNGQRELPKTLIREMIMIVRQL